MNFLNKDFIVKIFPSLQFVTCILACIVYLYYKEYRQACYWFFAAGITGTVAYLLK